jgi:glutathione S-transferase
MPLLHQFHLSGNCYKVRLAARHAGVRLELRDVDMMGGETRRPGFLEINPNGRVPVLQLEDGRALPESNAATWWLAKASPLWPQDDWARAEVLQWMFFEQYSHEPYIATRRFWLAFAPEDRLKEKEHMLQGWLDGGYAALAVMERHLNRHDWFAGGRFSIADISLYAYTHCAADGGFDLAAYPSVRRWLDRVAAAPGHIAIEDRL